MRGDDQERIPLRTILKNFINHIENLETNRIEDSYEKEFQDLKFFSEILKTLKQHSCSEGEKEVNRKKNRYKDILPFDTSRVILGEYAGVPGSDYINANFIKGASGSPAYIASQGPLPHTVNDFWRMVVECEVQVIVMACNQEEAGKHKCENYWVENEGEEKQFGMVSIRLLKASVVCPDFLVRTMMLKYTNNHSVTEERTVCQFHYSAWPDHGVPPLVRPLLDMVRLVRDTQASETLPVLVHCSAGCGRTGTICAIDYVFGLLRAGKLTKNFSLYALVRDMRKQRIAMVQTKEQYVLVHQAVRELFSEQLRIIDAHPYENIDAEGMPIYATLNGGEDTVEKQDGKEKNGSVSSLLDAPPLPDKKSGKKASSKQAKEVENLSEKQRCTMDVLSSDSETSSLSSGMSSLLSRPRISKLKALFERNLTPRESRPSSSRRRGAQPVARSHSLGPVRKPVQEQPIPGRGILRVPQLASAPVTPAPVKPALPVKRSKSLKVLGSGDHSKLSVPGPEYSHGVRRGNKMATIMKTTPIQESQGHGQVAYTAWRNYENLPGPLRRRHSLESVILEEVVPAASNHDNAGCSEFQTSRLDHEARKLLQDCRDYLDDSKTERLREGSRQFQHLSAEAQHKINAIVAGLGVRERRNSFRQAVGTSRDPSGRVQDYESIWPGPRGPTTVEALRKRREQQMSSPGTSAASGSRVLMDRESRNLADELAGFYRKPGDDIRVAHSKFKPKSLFQKSGGSLRVKGTQALAFVTGTEFDNAMSPQSQMQSRSKQPLQLSRSNPWPRENRSRPNITQGDCRPFPDPVKHSGGPDLNTKTPVRRDLQSAFDHSPYSDVLGSPQSQAGAKQVQTQFQMSRHIPPSVEANRKINSRPPGNHSGYGEVRSPLRRVAASVVETKVASTSRGEDQHIYVKSANPTTFHKTAFNGVAPSTELPSSVAKSYSAFQDLRGVARPSPGSMQRSPHKPNHWVDPAAKRRHEAMEAAGKVRLLNPNAPLASEPVSYGLMAGVQMMSPRSLPWSGVRDEGPGDVDLDAVAASIQPRRTVVEASTSRNLYARRPTQPETHSQSQGPPTLSPTVKKQQYL